MFSLIKLFPILIFFNILTSIKNIQEEDETIEASVYYIKTTGKYQVVEGSIDRMAAAYAKYTPSYEKKRLGFFSIIFI
jgi:hypothetical protein